MTPLLPDGAAYTSADDVVAQLCTSSRAKGLLSSWRAERPEVAQHVMQHVARCVYGLSLSELRGVMSETEHALGNVSRKSAEAVTEIRDWNPRFAMTHVFHYVLEQRQAAFTYQEFRRFCWDDDRARAMLWQPAQEAIAHAASSRGWDVARDAMRWRVGNAYYSFLRELVVLAEFRERGLVLQTHPLADALFRVDAWTGKTALGLYIGNIAYRDGGSGRKTLTSDILGPDFTFVPIRMATQHVYGSLHVPSAQELGRAVAEVRKAIESGRVQDSP